ncbi:hypothetical protein YDYSY3_06150 [Paenibacillus chitinolyticus]|uniref:DUF2062 domain-containing protein n=1 Tax=Paenibacillus chitinolyticus TaxID=79263 RepID=UPI0026E49F34|nr:DUF2062 domain-containing protein [Paenibacillus chitinolyticus]GKS09615.1 hypothetical protein YDYSY3_06150 [Paenibacillus chitinolyticus]
MQYSEGALRKKFDLKQTGRWFKYKYLLLLRAKGGPSMVATGFSIGLAVEMFTLPTVGLAFFLIFPLVWLLRGNFAGALIGFVFGKIIYVPMAILFNKPVGSLVVPPGFKEYLIHHVPAFLANVLKGSLELIVGGMIVGGILGLIMYFPIMLLLRLHASRRKDRRRLRKEHQHAMASGLPGDAD